MPLQTTVAFKADVDTNKQQYMPLQATTAFIKTTVDAFADNCREYVAFKADALTNNRKSMPLQTTAAFVKTTVNAFSDDYCEYLFLLPTDNAFADNCSKRLF